MRHKKVSRAAAVPVPDERLGEKVCLVVEPQVGLAVSAESILHHLDEAGLSKYDMPEYFVVLDAMPMTSSGKVFKRSLVDRIAAGELVPHPVRWQKPENG